MMQRKGKAPLSVVSQFWTGPCMPSLQPNHYGITLALMAVHLKAAYFSGCLAGLTALIAGTVIDDAGRAVYVPLPGQQGHVLVGVEFEDGGKVDVKVSCTHRHDCYLA